jgi:hypothetical protein
VSIFFYESIKPYFIHSFIVPTAQKHFSIPEKKNIQPLIFFNKKSFYEGIIDARQEKIGFNRHIAGAIIPHDLSVGFITARFFKKLAFQNPHTIVLIGPNHYERGGFHALTSMYSWQTPFGNVEPNRTYTKKDRIYEKIVPKNQLSGNTTHFCCRFPVNKSNCVSSLVPAVTFFLSPSLFLSAAL